MADLVLGALGIVPLIGLTIQSYRKMNQKLKLYRNSSNVVDRVGKKLRVQCRLFENECQLLLQVCLEGETVEDMMKDLHHPTWSSSVVGHDVREMMKGSYSDCTHLIQDILEAVRGLQSELEVYGNRKGKTKGKGRDCKETWKRVEDGIRISFMKESYEATIAELRSANIDLKNLRGQLGLLVHTPTKALEAKRSASETAGWSDIRRASKALHEALISAWSCGQSSHVRHVVKLFLDAEKAGDDVQMHIAILCHRMSQLSNQTDLVLLQVKSIQMVCNYRAQITQLLPAREGDERPLKRKKVVRFVESVREALPTTAPNKGGREHIDTSGKSSDLLGNKDFCASLLYQFNQRVVCTSTHCLGHIDVGSSGNYRHQFYASTGYCYSREPGPSELQTKNLTRMDSILENLTKYKFSTVDKLKMARSLVRAVLNFHATPWLGEFWRLRDLSFFDDDSDIARSLRTLHVDVEVQRQELEGSGLTANGNIAETTNLPEGQISRLEGMTRLNYDFNNISLHCLGVAMLQIDHSQNVEPSDVSGVKKLGKVPSMLGPRYQEITQKCLRCDFGYGVDLGEAQLQKAVYENVVGTLESMISVLDISDS